MYVIVSIQGCLPFVFVEQDDKKKDGRAKIFKTKEAAQKWAERNCAWQYKIVKV